MSSQSELPINIRIQNLLDSFPGICARPANGDDWAGDEQLDELIEPSAVLGCEESAINRLPPEILSQMVEVAYWSLIDDERGSFTRSITSVCGRWREVSLSVACLWSTIRVISSWNPECLAEYLARSRNCPLQLSIIVLSDDHDSVEESLAKFCAALIPYLSRCYSLSISTDKKGRTLHDFLDRICGAKVPVLQQLVVVGYAEEDSILRNSAFTQHYEPSLFIHGAPTLAEAKLQGSALCSSRPPLNNITALHLAGGSCLLEYDEFRQIIDSCPLLATLAIYGKIYTTWTGAGMNAPNLRSLKIYDTQGLLSEIFVSLLASELEDVVIVPVLPYDLEFLQTIQDQGPEPLFPEVMFLTIQPISHEELANVLNTLSRVFANVKTLTFPLTGEREDVDALNTKKSHIHRWPQLKEIYFGGYLDNDDVHLLLSMAQARKDADTGSPLDKIYLPSVTLETVIYSEENFLTRFERLGVSVEEVPVWDVSWPDGKSVRDAYFDDD